MCMYVYDDHICALVKRYIHTVRGFTSYVYWYDVLAYHCTTDIYISVLISLLLHINVSVYVYTLTRVYDNRYGRYFGPSAPEAGGVYTD